MDANVLELKGQIVDVVNDRIFSGAIYIHDGQIVDVKEEQHDEKQLIMPGLVDAHIHIESSMLVPSEYAKIDVVNGGVAAVCDPHEIANVLGMEGVKYMIEDGKSSPYKFFFGAPSCVPATPFETSGAVLGIEEIRALLQSDDIYFLGEMMNFPAVVNDEEEVCAKIKAALEKGKPVDGHAPGLKGTELTHYCNAGITTDHECYAKDEALEKLNHGMKILIREGSAAHNFDDLIPIMNIAPENLMFCADDKHPDELVEGHINLMVKRAIALGYNILDVIKSATLNPVRHYRLPVGLLQKNDPADFIIVDNFNDFNVLQTYINGILVAENGKTLLSSSKPYCINNFNIDSFSPQDFKVEYHGKNIRVIDIVKNQIVTNSFVAVPKVVDGNIVSDVEHDILKIAVVNRYSKAKPAVAFVHNFGLKKGALASSVAHDSHNIVVVGCTDEDIAAAVNTVINSKGGIVAYSNNNTVEIQLPVAGIMSADNGFDVAAKYRKINEKAKELGCDINAPFMTLSFMALLVIPQLKLSDKGLFDSSAMRFVSIDAE